MIYEYDNLKEIKVRYDELVVEKQKLNDIKIQYDKLNKEFPKLKEIKEKYYKILKEQNNLIIIENKYNDIIQEIQELREIKIKYEELLFKKGQDINSTEIEKELSLKINEYNILNENCQKFCQKIISALNLQIQQDIQVN